MQSWIVMPGNWVWYGEFNDDGTPCFSHRVWVCDMHLPVTKRQQLLASADVSADSRQQLDRH